LTCRKCSTEVINDQAVRDPEKGHEAENLAISLHRQLHRSRFAELLFNHLASRLELDWLASSRGLELELGVNNIGPISHHVLKALDARGIRLDAEVRSPLAANPAELENAHHIVAVNRAEHLRMLEGRFPQVVKRVESWDVHDTAFTIPDEAMAQLESNVVGLINRLLL
jgi:protein-tyrosine phosphatase